MSDEITHKGKYRDRSSSGDRRRSGADEPATIGRGSGNGTLKDLDEALSKYLRIRNVPKTNFNGRFSGNGHANGNGRH